MKENVILEKTDQGKCPGILARPWCVVRSLLEYQKYSRPHQRPSCLMELVTLEFFQTLKRLSNDGQERKSKGVFCVNVFYCTAMSYCENTFSFWIFFFTEECALECSAESVGIFEDGICGMFIFRCNWQIRFRRCYRQKTMNWRMLPSCRLNKIIAFIIAGRRVWYNGARRSDVKSEM